MRSGEVRCLGMIMLERMAVQMIEDKMRIVGEVNVRSGEIW